MRKPWVIYVTDNRDLGKPVRLLARPTEGQWTMKRRRAVKFRTVEEATAYLKTFEKQAGHSYFPQQL